MERWRLEGTKVYITKKSILNPLLIWIIYLRNQLLMERENRMTEEEAVNSRDFSW